jgi:hypothetical protein
MAIDLEAILNLPAPDRLEVVYMLFDSLPEDVDCSQMSDFAFAEYQLRRKMVAANPALKYPRTPQGEVVST